MKYVKFNPKPFDHHFNSFVDDIITELPVFFNKEFNISERKGFAPVNVKETENSYQLEVIAPGFEKNDFKISLDKELLTISGEKKTDVQTDSPATGKDKSIRKEYNHSSFKRSFTIDNKIDATNIEANYVNGILKLNLPKKADVKAPVKEIVIN